MTTGSRCWSCNQYDPRQIHLVSLEHFADEVRTPKNNIGGRVLHSDVTEDLDWIQSLAFEPSLMINVALYTVCYSPILKVSRSKVSMASPQTKWLTYPRNIAKSKPKG